METKRIVKYLVVIAITGLVFVGCKKKDDPAVQPADDAAQQAQTASDQSRMEKTSDQSMDDANSVMDGISTTRSGAFPCNVIIDSSSASVGLIKLTFNGANCDNTYSRTGSINIQLPYNGTTVTRWHVAGATITLTYNNYKVTDLSNNVSLTFNGTHSVTNVSGGRLINITSGNPIIHKVRGNLQLTFDDGTQRSWGVARTRTFSIANNVLSSQVTGDTTINTNASVAMWGVNRAGENFAIAVTNPVVVNLLGGTCLHKPLSGVRVHYGIARVLTVTYGVDVNGVAETPGTCPYGYRFNWTNGQGVAKQVIKAY